MNYLIHCIMSSGIWIEFCWVPSNCGIYWNEISDTLAKKYSTKNVSEISYNNLQISYHAIAPTLEKTVYQELQRSQSAIPSCLRYLARVIYKLRLHSRNTKYSRNVTCVWRNILSVKNILLECRITTELFQKNGFDLTACNNVRNIWYNTDVINHIVK